ncbi:MAG: glycosyl hydrolase family 28 protein [Cyclobacteriaceae bacterium]
MYKYSIICLIVIAGCFPGNLLAKRFDVTQYGVIPDGKTLTTEKIQQVIDLCSKDGGEVYFPAGVYLTGSLILKSNVSLYFANGSILKGSQSIEDYPLHGSSHSFAHDSLQMRTLLLADSQENIVIKGSGTIDGSGQSADFSLQQKVRPVRPMVLRFIACKNITVEDIMLRQSPMWMQQYVACENVRISGINVYNHANRHNDGLDIVGCKNVIITGCNISSDDDAICFKTLSAATNENIIVANNIVASNCNGIKIGTETRSAIKNFSISNNILKPTEVFSETWKRDIGIAGLAIESVDGADVSDIIVSGLVIKGYYTPLFIRLGNRGRKFKADDPKPAVGSIENISLTNIKGIAERPPEVVVSGIPGYKIKSIQLQNVTIIAKGNGKTSHTAIPVPEAISDYPTPMMFGLYLPAYGMYFRHIKDLTLDNVKLSYLEQDERHAIVLSDVTNAWIDRLKCLSPASNVSVFKIENSQEIIIRNPFVDNSAQSFLEVVGKDSKHIELEAKYLADIQELVRLDPEVDPQSISIIK